MAEENLIEEYERIRQNVVYDLANIFNEEESSGMFDAIEFQIFKVILILLGSAYLIFAIIV